MHFRFYDGEILDCKSESVSAIGDSSYKQKQPRQGLSLKITSTRLVYRYFTLGKYYIQVDKSHIYDMHHTLTTVIVVAFAITVIVTTLN